MLLEVCARLSCPIEHLYKNKTAHLSNTLHALLIDEASAKFSLAHAKLLRYSEFKATDGCDSSAIKTKTNERCRLGTFEREFLSGNYYFF